MKIKPYLTHTIIAISILLFGVLTEENILFPRFNKSYVQRFQKIYSTKEKELNKVITELTVFLNKTQHLQANDFVISKHIDLLENKGLAVFVYENDSLRLWSDNSVPISSLYSESKIDSTLLYLGNAWYVPRTIKLKRFTLVGLIQIKQAYQYENKFLTSVFQKDFNASPTVKISLTKVNDAKNFAIEDCRNRVLFFLVFDRNTHHALFQAYIPSISYFFLIIYLLWVIAQAIHCIPVIKKRNAIVIYTTIAILGLKMGMLYFQIPKVFYQLDLFKPQYFATSDLFPSLGDLLLWSIIISALTFIFYRSYSYSSPSNNLWLLRLNLFIRLILIWIVFYVIFLLIKSIILNSTISFEANKLLLFDSYSFFGYVIIMFLFISFTLYFNKILKLYHNQIIFIEISLFFLLSSLICVCLLYLINVPIDYISVVFIIILGLLFIHIQFNVKNGYTYSTFI